jgi:hypothetical protein
MVKRSTLPGVGITELSINAIKMMPKAPRLRIQ